MNTRGFVDKKALADGIVWNVVSLAVLAVGGLLFTTIIASSYESPSVLAAFNSIYAYYIVFSQFAVFGLHNAALRYVSAAPDAKRGPIARQALSLCLAVSCAVCAVVFAALLLIGRAAPSQIITGLMYTCPALVCFSLNKVILSVLNAELKMRAYAVFQAARYVFLCLFLIILSSKKVSPAQLALSFLYTEGLLLAAQTVFLAATSDKKRLFAPADKKMYGELLLFGRRILLSNVVLELNTRVDIICLGWLLPDKDAMGVYSFALVFADGFYQLLVVVRRNINPYIAKCAASGDWTEYKRLRGKLSKIAVWALPLLVACVCGGYALVCRLLVGARYLAGILPLLIILAGQSAAALPSVFGNTLSQSGFPSDESTVNTITVACNFVLNLLLIPLLGVYGAAVATSLSYIVFAAAQARFIRRDIPELSEQAVLKKSE